MFIHVIIAKYVKRVRKRSRGPFLLNMLVVFVVPSKFMKYSCVYASSLILQHFWKTRYPDDRFDRYWQPFMGNTRAISGAEDISASGFWNLPPSNVFSTGLTTDQDNSMELQWPPVFLPSSTYYVALYFADKSFGGARAFDIFLNDYSFYNNLKVTSSGLVVFATQWNLSGLTKITLLPSSSMPPIINAGEIFGILSLGGITSTRDGMSTKNYI